MKYINDCIIPVCNNFTTVVGEAETLAKIISVGVAVGAPGTLVGVGVADGPGVLVAVGAGVLVAVGAGVLVGCPGGVVGVGVGVLVGVGVRVGVGV